MTAAAGVIEGPCQPPLFKYSNDRCTDDPARPAPPPHPPHRLVIKEALHAISVRAKSSAPLTTKDGGRIVSPKGRRHGMWIMIAGG